MSVPILDHQHFTHGNEKQRSEYAEQLVASLKSHGFVKLINHGIDDLTIDELFKRTKDFFTLPRDIQKAVAHQASDNPQRGWSSVGMEQTSHLYGRNSDRSDGELKDCKEHYDIGPPYDTQFPNQWLPDHKLPGWRAFMENYWQQCQTVALSLISAIELGLSIPAGTIASRCLPSASEVRLNHYPAIPTRELANGSTARIWPHTDFGIITLLLTDSVGGLEIQDPCSPRTFIPVSRGARNEMIVNAADTLQRWTNGVLKAGLHRVMLPPGVQGESDAEVIEERWSIPYLFKARREARVGALKEFVSEERRSKYEDLTALEFQLRRQHQVYSDEQLSVA